MTYSLTQVYACASVSRPRLTTSSPATGGAFGTSCRSSAIAAAASMSASAGRSGVVVSLCDAVLRARRGIEERSGSTPNERQKGFLTKFIVGQIAEDTGGCCSWSVVLLYRVCVGRNAQGCESAPRWNRLHPREAVLLQGSASGQSPVVGELAIRLTIVVR